MKTRFTMVFCFLCMLASACFPCVASAEDALPPQPRNPDFEQPAATDDADVCPEHWFWFSSTNEPRIHVTKEHAKRGAQSCRFRAQRDTDAYQGIAQQFRSTPGHRYTFSAQIMNDRRDPITGDSYGQISFEWQNAHGKEISREHGPTWNHELSFDKWTQFVVDGQAPEGAVVGVVVITFFSQNSGGYGSLYVDDCGFSTRSGLLR